MNCRTCATQVFFPSGPHWCRLIRASNCRDRFKQWSISAAFGHGTKPPPLCSVKVVHGCLCLRHKMNEGFCLSCMCDLSQETPWWSDKVCTCSTDSGAPVAHKVTSSRQQQRGLWAHRSWSSERWGYSRCLGSRLKLWPEGLQGKIVAKANHLSVDTSQFVLC